MSFELTNASITLQTYIYKTLRRFVDIICIIHLNSILKYDKESTIHRYHMHQVLQRFRVLKLYVNLKKCEFNIEKVEFLNFIIFIKEIRMNSKRVQMIKEWLKLKIYREMQLFLGFVNFYRRFIYRYFKIVTPLTNLFKNNENEKKKSSFEWSDEVVQAFHQFKHIFISISPFIYYNFLKRNRMKINISNFVVANILSQ